MTRREFLKAAFGTLLFYATRHLAVGKSSQNYEVGIAVNKNYEKAVETAINLIGGIRKYVKPGDIVVVKPNIGWNSLPEYKADTDPVIVRTVVHLCYMALASKVYVFDRTCNNPKLAYHNSGIAEAAKEAGARVLYVNRVTDKLYKQIDIKNGTFLKKTLINKYVLKADVFINLPVAKSHSAAGLTIGMKNLMGITGDNRSKWHWDLHNAISDVNIAVKTNLLVVDATNIMFKNGPTGGSLNYLKKLDTVIASNNVLCGDAEAAKLFGINPADIGYMTLGQKKGVGILNGYAVKRA